jgi:hypothetical protein
MGTQYKKKGKNNKTKRRKKKGGTPFGIIPVVTYNDGDDRLVEVAVQNKVDNTAYVDRNRVYPVDNDTSSLFDYNNIYDKTISFFTRPDSKISDPLVTRTVKIGINSEKDMEKIAVLNKMIRRYNLLKGVNRRKKGMVGGGDEGNEKDLLNSLSPRETEIARKLIDGGVFNKLLQGHHESGASLVENQHAQLLRQEQLLNKQLASLKARPPKVDNLEKSDLPLENSDYNYGSYYIRQIRAAPTATSSTSASASAVAGTPTSTSAVAGTPTSTSTSTSTSASAVAGTSTSATSAVAGTSPSATTAVAGTPTPTPTYSSYSSTSATTTEVVPPKPPRRGTPPGITSVATTGPSADASALIDAAKKLEESNKATIATLQSQIGSLTQDIANQTFTRLLEQKMFTDEKNRIKDSLSRDITELKNNLNSVSQEKANAVSEIETLKEGVLEKETNLGTLRKEHEEINKTKTALDTEIATLKQEISSISNESTKKIEDLNKWISDTNTTVFDLNIEMTKKENEFKTLSGLQAVQNQEIRDKLLLEKDALTADLLKLQNEISTTSASFEIEKDEWSRELDEKEKSILTLNSDSAAKQSEIDNLRQNIASSNTELATKTTELAIQQSRMDNEIKQFQTEITKKKAEVLNAQAEFAAVSAELQSAKLAWDNEKENLNTEQQKKADEIVTLTEQINNLRNSESKLCDVIHDTSNQLTTAKAECDFEINQLRQILSNKDIEIGHLKNQAAATAALAPASSALPSASALSSTALASAALASSASSTSASSGAKAKPIIADEQDLELIKDIIFDLPENKKESVTKLAKKTNFYKNLLKSKNIDIPEFADIEEIREKLHEAKIKYANLNTLIHIEEIKRLPKLSDVEVKEKESLKTKLQEEIESMSDKDHKTQKEKELNEVEKELENERIKLKPRLSEEELRELEKQQEHVTNIMNKIYDAEHATSEYKREQEHKESEKNKVLEPFLKKCYDEMLKFIDADLLSKSVEKLIELGYSKSLAKRIFNNKDCFRLITKSKEDLAKTMYSDLKSCVGSFDIIECGAIIYNLPVFNDTNDNDKNKRKWVTELKITFDDMYKKLSESELTDFEKLKVAYGNKKRHAAYKDENGKAGHSASSVASLPTPSSSSASSASASFTTLPPTPSSSSNLSSTEKVDLKGALNTLFTKKQSSSASTSANASSTQSSSTSANASSTQSSSTFANLPPTPPQPGTNLFSAASTFAIGDQVTYVKDSAKYFVTSYKGVKIPTRKYTLCKSYPCGPGDTQIDNVPGSDLQKAPP